MPFRTYQRDGNVPGLPSEDAGEVSYEDIDTGAKMKVGHPASRDMTVYIFSRGQNLEMNQLWCENYANPDAAPDQVGGGDDINNWDEGQSWRVFYR